MDNSSFEKVKVRELINFLHQKEGFGTNWTCSELGEDRIELEDGKESKFSLMANTSYTWTLIRLKGSFEEKQDTAIFQAVCEFFTKEEIHAFLIHGDRLFRENMNDVRLAKFQALTPTTKQAKKVLNLLHAVYNCNLQLLETLTIGNKHRNSYELACYFEEQMIVVLVNGTKNSSQFQMIYRTLFSEDEARSFQQEVQKELQRIQQSEEQILALIKETDDEAEYDQETNLITVFDRTVPFHFEKKYPHGEGVCYALPAFNKQYEGWESFPKWETAMDFLTQTVTEYLRKNRLYHITGATEDSYTF